MILRTRVRAHPRLQLLIDIFPTNVGVPVYRSCVLYGRDLETGGPTKGVPHTTPLPMRTAPVTPEGLAKLIMEAIHDMEGADHGGTLPTPRRRRA